MQEIYQGSFGLETLPDLAKLVSKHLTESGSSFSLCLIGGLGYGKTNLTELILAELGVKQFAGSPTFTYLNEYRVGEKRYAHLDFYRIEGQANGLESFMATDWDGYDGVILEWCEKIYDLSPYDATHVISIEKYSSDNRNYKLFKI